MKQKHIFLISITHDEDENRIFTKVVQGPIKKDYETVYVVDDNGNDHWVSKDIFKKFEVVKDSYLPEGCKMPIVDYNMGFIWKDGDDENYVRYMASECQRKCKMPVLERCQEICDEIRRSIDKLMKSKISIKI